MEILKRGDVETQYKWATEHIYENDDAWFAAYNNLGKSFDYLKSFEGKLFSSDKTLLEYLEFRDKILVEFDNIYAYAMLKKDENTADAKAQDMYGKVCAAAAGISTAVSFETPEIIATEQKIIDDFLAKNKKLQVYKLFFEKIKRQSEHTLSTAEEAILASATEISRSPDTIYTVFQNADLKFPQVTDIKGNKHNLNAGSFIMLLQNNDRALRKSVYESYYGEYNKYKNTTAAFLNAQIKQLSFFTKTRKYNSNLERALFVNDVPVDVYTNLISAVNKNLKYMHKYIRLRKKLLKVDDLYFYDLYTPIVADCDIKMDYQKSKDVCLEALQILGEDYISLLKTAFDNRWVDVHQTENKRNGAYSLGTFVHPFVLLNHDDKLDSAFTLAHEMGHALHSYYSIKTQPVVYSDYVIFVAEVASTFNESLLMQHLLKKTTDKREKAYLINYFLEQFRGTIYRQTMFAEFELEMNTQSEKGNVLTSELLCSIYRELNKKYYGPDIVVDEEICLEWARIPHFFRNFYVFQYSTGFAAAIALSQRVLKGENNAVLDYLKFISMGCSDTPINLLKAAGVDMTDDKPINDALSLFNSLIDELEALSS